MPVMNDPALIIPVLDKVPLMAHPVLQKVLLLLTFILHIIPMNILVGGIAFAVIMKSQKLLKIGNYEMAYRLYRDILKLLPTALSFTISLGVAPLLFIQALYGPLFYTATILMAPFWLLILPVITFNYYGLYLLSWTGEKTLKPLRLPLLILMLGGFVYTAFMLSSNNSFMQAPQKFYRVYQSTFYGFYIYANDINLWVRFGHMLVGAVFVASLFLYVMAYFKGKNDIAYSEYIISYARPLFLLSFLAQASIGFSMLYIQKPEIYNSLMGKNANYTFVFWTGIILAFALAGFGHLKPASLRRGRVQVMIGFAAFVSITCMAVVRDFIRDGEIGAAFSYLDNPYDWNYIVVGSFAVILIIGLGTIYYMLTLPEKKPAPAPVPNK